ncbi:MAG: hypothetical protein ACR2RV_15310 [Verrucomicrobiales bacterium]
MKIVALVLTMVFCVALICGAREDALVVDEQDHDSLEFELPTAIKLRVDLARMQRPEFIESSKAIGIQATGEEDYRSDAPAWAHVFRASDGLVFLVDDLNMALWVREGDRWKCLFSNLRVMKTFGGAFPALPVRYLGGGYFAVSETVPGEVEERTEEGFPQALAVTFLIDSKQGTIKERSSSYRYDHTPPVQVPKSWIERYKLKGVVYESEQHKTTQGQNERGKGQTKSD